MWKEFKEFISKGSVIDLAIGVIVGAAFGKIVASLVKDIIMPLLGIITGGIKFSDRVIHLKYTGFNLVHHDVPLEYGNFIQEVFNFLIIAAALFLVIKVVNKFRKKKEEAPAPATPEDVVLLREIRDLLKNK